VLRSIWLLAAILALFWTHADIRASDPPDRRPASGEPSNAFNRDEQIKKAKQTIRNLLLQLEFDSREKKKSLEIFKDTYKIIDDRMTRKMIDEIIQQKKNVLEGYEKAQRAISDLANELDELIREPQWDARRFDKLAKRLKDLKTSADKILIRPEPIPLLMHLYTERREP